MTELAIEEARYLSVTELTNLLRISLESEFPSINFEGEISGLKKATSGHIYFTIKDSNSQVPAVIWRGAAKVDFNIEDGLHVYCQGKVTVYPAQGRLQVVVTKISPAGEGLLQKKFLALKKKLEEEGLFAAHRKRPIPYLPKAVGVVTSDKGAVINDIMVKLHERLPSIDAYLVPVRVQGKGAAEEIVEGIKLLNRSGLVDVIIVGRGGGSLEDLWAFNEEVLVRAIFASQIPIVSAVGHESDISLSDLVADVRAPTPTAAAEMVVPLKKDIESRLDELFNRISDFVGRLDPFWQRIDEVELRLNTAIHNELHKKDLMLKTLQSKVRLIEPKNIIEILRKNILSLGERLFNKGNETLKAHEFTLRDVNSKFVFAEKRYLEGLSAKLSNFESRLQGVNPHNVLKRGFSIVTVRGEVVTNIDQLKVEDLVNLKLSTGSAEAKIKSLIKE